MRILKGKEVKYLCLLGIVPMNNVKSVFFIVIKCIFKKWAHVSKSEAHLLYKINSSINIIMCVMYRVLELWSGNFGGGADTSCQFLMQ